MPLSGVYFLLHALLLEYFSTQLKVYHTPNCFWRILRVGGARRRSGPGRGTRNRFGVSVRILMRWGPVIRSRNTANGSCERGNDSEGIGRRCLRSTPWPTRFKKSHHRFRPISNSPWMALTGERGRREKKNRITPFKLRNNKRPRSSTNFSNFFMNQKY